MLYHSLEQWEDGLTTRSSLMLYAGRKARQCMPTEGAPTPSLHPQPAHLHALNVLKHDIPDSLVISSDVGI